MYTLFSVSFLTYFRIVYIWPMYHSSDERIQFAVIFSSMRVTFCSKFDFLDPCPMGGLIKSLFSVCLSICLSVCMSVCLLSVCLSVHQQFSTKLRNGLLIVFWFFAPWYIIGILKNWLSIFSRKIHFSPNLGKNCPK